MKRQTIFLNNVTVADFAWVTPQGKLAGDSVRLKFEVTGDVEQDTTSEQVVEDFSTIKSRLKKAIDGKACGIDHRLVIPFVLDGSTPKPLVGTLLTHNKQDGKPVTYTYVTAHFNVTLPEDALCFVYVLDEPDSVIGDVDSITGESLVKSYLNTMLREQFPEFKIKVHLDNNFNSHFVCNKYTHSSLNKMSYTHGLPTSSSYGCQNIVHGHLSYVQLVGLRKDYATPAYTKDLENLSREIAQHLDGAYLYSAEYSSEEPNNKDLVLSYTTIERGEFHLHLNSATAYKGNALCLGDGYTTVENFADYLAKEFAVQLKNLSVTSLYVSEGLEKGCVINF